jgi:DNA invertase Pin-like site-specific DNA recombinase
MKYGYARVSMRTQQDASQITELEAYGVDHLYVDHGVSGKKAKRPELDKCLAAMSEGDSFVITRLSRAMRNIREMLAMADDFKSRGIALVVLKQDIDTSTPTGRLIFHLLAAIDEWQRELIVESTLEGLEAARAAGKQIGAPRALDDDQVANAVKMIQAGMSKPDVAGILGCSVATLYRRLGEASQEAATA